MDLKAETEQRTSAGTRMILWTINDGYMTASSELLAQRDPSLPRLCCKT